MLEMELEDMEHSCIYYILACFVKLSVKSSSAAKLFNAVHKRHRYPGNVSALDPSAERRKRTEDMGTEN